MRKIVAGFASSLDGYIEGPNGEADWITIDDEIDFAEMMARYDTYFYGRKSYEVIAKMNSKPSPKIKNYVFSSTLQSVNPGYDLIKDNIKENVLRIKNEPGKDIAVWGGASLLASLLDLKLVDEISVAVIPVMLGSGKPMVEILKEKIKLTLVSSRTYKNGTVALTYNVNE